MKFRLQSLNDVVTNSSMEVYQEATQYTVDAVKDIINVILKIGGSDKSCDDLFTVSIDYSDMLEDEDGHYINDSEAYQELVKMGLVGDVLETIEEFTRNFDSDWRYPTTKYYLIPIQSFSDVITNSSSETYVVDTSYTAKALQRALEAIHKQHENAEYYSGECCGIEVSDFKEFCRESYMYEDHDEYGVPFQSKEEYLAWVWELPVNVLRECLFVRVDYGFSYVDKFLVENFKCISSDHERPKNEEGRIVKY